MKAIASKEEWFIADVTGIIEPSAFEKVSILEKKLANTVIDYERFISFVKETLTHEQHTRFVERYKEVFGK